MLDHFDLFLYVSGMLEVNKFTNLRWKLMMTDTYTRKAEEIIDDVLNVDQKDQFYTKKLLPLSNEIEKW